VLPLPILFGCHPPEARGPYLRRFFTGLAATRVNFAGDGLAEDRRPVVPRDFSPVVVAHV